VDTRSLLFDLYGPLLTYAQLAKVLDRTVDGLKTSMSKKGTETEQQLGAARIRIGRRVYFRTEQIADLLESTGKQA